MNDDTVIGQRPVIFPAEGSSGGPWLFVIEGKALGRSVPVGAPGVRIGRRPENDLVLDSPAVSKFHAQITVDRDQCFVEDLGSTNGSLVNQVPLPPHGKRLLCHGDVMAFGDHTVILRQDGGGFADKTGMSTISFDMSKVREEADALWRDLGIRKPGPARVSGAPPPDR